MKTVWQKLSQWFDRYATVLKLLFVVSVLIFVVREVGRILREVNGQQIRQSLASQSPQSLVLMLVLGFVSVLPMLGYDFAITELLPGKFTKRYIVKSGWVVNTYTNIAGFGGLLGGSLRALFYAKEASKKQILTAISKIALFLLSGLSVASAVSLVLIFGLHQGAVYGRYWVWLAAGALYFPVVFIMTRTTKGEFFCGLDAASPRALTVEFDFGMGRLRRLFPGYRASIGTILDVGRLPHVCRRVPVWGYFNGSWWPRVL